MKNDAMEWDVPIDYLIKREGLQYEEYDLNEEGFLKRYITNPIKKIVKVIKAAIIIPEKVILIDTDLHYAKKPFAQVHELGHNTIPEHKEIFYVCSEHDLNPQTRKEMEFEANVFASEILFPEPLIESIHENYPLSMETILHLKQISNGSIHSSAIKYVETSNKECCLLILKEDKDGKGNPGLRLMTQILSVPWWERYKRLIPDRQLFPVNHVLSSIVFSGKAEEIQKGTITVRDKQFQFHAFYNSYIVMALVFE